MDAELWAEFLLSPTAYVFVAVFGALWGSFGNVCIYRMPPTEEHPKGRSVVSPGSHCFECGNDVRWHDNVPLLSFLWLRGQCRDCKATFSPRYLLVEAATAILFVAIYHYVIAIAYIYDSPTDQMIRVGIWCALAWTLVVITFIDLDHFLILDKITYPAIVIFFALGLLLDGSWKQGLIGIAVGYGAIRAISDGYYFLTKREGMGYGDGKLLALVGALFGWQGVLVAMFGGSLLGSVIMISILAATRSSEGSAEESDEEESEAGLGKVAVPFGPFLAMGALLYLFTESYLRVHFYVFWE